ncbi:hypothetical protein TNCT_639021 [Trichonephila clavata]|uniref:Uncharacterized protein n=1 Tax=Trichonephila clavata TaxID=2740835 RepID=A0A8X6I778_TRICU|nr:hypothetical protein TNCT_639021 [Trichonephila clavata]
MLLKLIPSDFVLGIKDPSEKRSKLKLQDHALKHFENTVLRDDEGRYIVSIPWIEGSEKLEDHYSLAKGKLEKTAAATPSTQPCSSVSNDGARLEPRAEASGHQQAEISSMQPCPSVPSDAAGVKPRVETLELPDDLTSDFRLQQPDLDDLVMVDS